MSKMRRRISCKVCGGTLSYEHRFRHAMMHAQVPTVNVFTEYQCTIYPGVLGMIKDCFELDDEPAEATVTKKEVNEQKETRSIKSLRSRQISIPLKSFRPPVMKEENVTNSEYEKCERSCSKTSRQSPITASQSSFPNDNALTKKMDRKQMEAEPETVTSPAAKTQISLLETKCPSPLLSSTLKEDVSITSSALNETDSAPTVTARSEASTKRKGSPVAESQSVRKKKPCTSAVDRVLPPVFSVNDSQNVCQKCRKTIKGTGRKIDHVFLHIRRFTEDDTPRFVCDASDDGCSENFGSVTRGILVEHLRRQHDVPAKTLDDGSLDHLIIDNGLKLTDDFNNMQMVCFGEIQHSDTDSMVTKNKQKQSSSAADEMVVDVDCKGSSAAKKGPTGEKTVSSESQKENVNISLPTTPFDSSTTADAKSTTSPALNSVKSPPQNGCSPCLVLTKTTTGDQDKIDEITIADDGLKMVCDDDLATTENGQIQKQDCGIGGEDCALLVDEEADDDLLVDVENVSFGQQSIVPSVDEEPIRQLDDDDDGEDSDYSSDDEDDFLLKALARADPNFDEMNTPPILRAALQLQTPTSTSLGMDVSSVSSVNNVISRGPLTSSEKIAVSDVLMELVDEVCTEEE